MQVTAAANPRQAGDGDRARRVIDTLLPLLGDPNLNVRAAAAQTLGRTADERTEALLGTLLPLLSGANVEVLRSAIHATTDPDSVKDDPRGPTTCSEL